jgi:hypothetical protein
MTNWLHQLGPTKVRTAIILTLAGALGVGLGLAVVPSEPVVPIPVPASTPTQMQVEVRDVPMFHGVSFTRRDGNTSAIQVMILAGDEQSVAVVARDGQHQAVQTRVIDSILYIQLDRDLQDLGALRIKVASPRLKSIHMDGVSSVRVNGGLRTESVNIEARHGAEITARRLGARQVSVTAHTGGKILIGGQVNLLRAQAKSGVINARDLSTEIAQVSSVQRSRIEVNAQERLEAFARDRASILYRTEPRRVLRDLDHSSRLQML